MDYEFIDQYFNWLCHFIGGCGRYEKLYRQMHDTAFVYLIAMDSNRAEDGISLRTRYEFEMGMPSGSFISAYGNRPCSIFEMMVALSIRCENDIMSDDFYNDRTYYWFEKMVKNLGLADMTDSNYDYDKVSFILDRFLYRQYAPNGEGGLFIINKPGIDVRSMEIWIQMNWYLNDYI